MAGGTVRVNGVGRRRYRVPAVGSHAGLSVGNGRVASGQNCRRMYGFSSSAIASGRLFLLAVAGSEARALERSATPVERWHEVHRQRSVLSRHDSRRSHVPAACPGSAAVICPGIFRLTVPVGSSGGWNYGRHHLMAWGADGVYAVSADRALRSIAASLVHSPVCRGPMLWLWLRSAYMPSCPRDVSCVSPERGQRLWTGWQMPSVPDGAVSKELWTADPAGRVTVLTARGGYFSRTDVAVLTFCTEGCGAAAFS